MNVKFLKNVIVFLIYLTPVFCFAEGNLIISEIQISGYRSTDEYIKIYNSSGTDINLYNYKIIKKTSSGSQYNLISGFDENTIVRAGEYFLIAHKDYSSYGYGFPVDFYYTNTSYSLSKDNSLYLMNNKSEILDIVGFGNCFEKEGETCLNNLNDYEIYRRNNNIDTNNNINDFILIGSSGYGKATEENMNVVDIPDTINSVTPNFIMNYPVENIKIFYPQNIIFSEIYPNPIADQEEFIEIKNNGITPIDLKNYKIKDSSKRIFSIGNIILKQNELYVFYKSQTGIAMNNSGAEHLYLLTPNNDVIQDLYYYNTKIGNSYAFDLENKTYLWTKNITPGFDNIIEKENSLPMIDCKIPNNVFVDIAFNLDCSDSYDEDGEEIRFFIDIGDGRTFDENNFYVRYFSQGKYLIKITAIDGSGGQNFLEHKIEVSNNLEQSGFLFVENDIKDKNKNEDEDEGGCLRIDKEEIQDADVGGCVIIESSVIVLPGIFSEKYFYLDGAQVYFGKQNFPELKNGDLLRVRGEISSNRGEKRIKVSREEDIFVYKDSFIKEEYYEIYDKEDLALNVSRLVSVNGEIISKTKNHIIIKNLKGEEFDIYINNKLYLNNNITRTLDEVKKGDNVVAIGIVGVIDNKFRVLLRDFNDINVVKIYKNLENKKVDFNAATIFDLSDNDYGELDTDKVINIDNKNEYVIDVNKSKRNVFIIGLVGAIVLFFLLLFGLINKYKKQL